MTIVYECLVLNQTSVVGISTQSLNSSVLLLYSFVLCLSCQMLCVSIDHDDPWMFFFSGACGWCSYALALYQGSVII
jgi:hypothetical protein